MSGNSSDIFKNIRTGPRTKGEEQLKASVGSGVIRVRISVLQHTFSVAIPPLYITFNDFLEAKSFKLSSVAVCNEIGERLNLSDLNVKIERDSSGISEIEIPGL